MNVSNSNKIDNLPQIQPSTGVPPSKTGGNAPAAHDATDTAQLSAAASLAAQSASEPEVRLDKLASIQSALQAGTYSVPASAVAQKVIGTLLVEDK